MARRGAVLLALLAGAGLPAAAAAPARAALAPFGHACTLEHGVRFCPTASDAGRVPSFDGTPLDVDVTLPATGSGPWPTIVLLQGYGGDKTSYEATTSAGDGSTTYNWNNVYFARHGYAVVNPTARGFGSSCGGGPQKAATYLPGSVCADGFIRLDDTRHEVRDVQYLLGELVDEQIAQPRHLGTTGISYGGGASSSLAYLRDRVRLPDGSYQRWRSPRRHIALSIDAAWARWQFSDLVGALLPNGRFLDTQVATSKQSLGPIGVPIQSYITGLYALGATSGYYCGGGPGSTPCPDRDANLTLDIAEVTKGLPLGPDGQQAIRGIYEHDAAGGLALSGGRAAPLLLQDGWTDDLFAPEQALRIYNQLRALDPDAPVSLQFGDLGHAPATNKPRVNRGFNAQGDAFLAHYLKGTPGGPAPGQVSAYTQTCPYGTPDGGPFTASSYRRLAAGTASLGSGAAQTFTGDGGNPLVAEALDPIVNSEAPGAPKDLACKTVAAQHEPNVARYEHTTRRGFTLLGLPTVHAHVLWTGSFPQIDARLWDVDPQAHTQRLVTRGDYRISDQVGAGTQAVTFQLHGNGYRFAPGHIVKLELLGRDAPYYRPSNGEFAVTVSQLTATLPTANPPGAAGRNQPSGNRPAGDRAGSGGELPGPTPRGGVQTGEGGTADRGLARNG